jgi:tRNA uridine 5-carboxymethylaminomethyl modification enzyme
MFTSRAEYRLSLREDNADARLTPIAQKLGLVNDQRWQVFLRKQDAVSRETSRLKNFWVGPKHESARPLESFLGQGLAHECTLAELLRRPGLDYKGLITSFPNFAPAVTPLDEDPMIAMQIRDQVEVAIKYEGYIERQRLEIERHQHYEALALPEALDYALVSGLSVEVQQKLNFHKPNTLGQAARISGVTPAAISLLLAHLKKGIYKTQTLTANL